MAVTGQGKVPYRIMLKSEQLFTLAGLWDEWADKSTGEMLHTFTIITTEAEELWLDEHETQEGLLLLLQRTG